MKNYIVILNDYEKFKSEVEEVKKKYNINEFDIKIYSAGEINIEKILNEFEREPVFSEKSLLIIKNVEELSKSDCEKLHNFLKKIPPDIIVILYGLSINPPFEESHETNIEFLSPENIFFKKIYSIKDKNDRKILEILKEYMRVREKNFTSLISGLEIYFRNILKKEKDLSREMVKKFELLHNFDYSLKTGRIELGSELELYLLYYFLSGSS